MKPPEMPRAIMQSVPEHHIVLAFVNDIDAETFADWWYEQGQRAFLKYADSRETE